MPGRSHAANDRRDELLGFRASQQQTDREAGDAEPPAGGGSVLREQFGPDRQSDRRCGQQKQSYRHVALRSWVTAVVGRR